eukprot:956603-Alexandrium_andersonii.AAC.1
MGVRGLAQQPRAPGPPRAPPAMSLMRCMAARAPARLGPRSGHHKLATALTCLLYTSDAADDM